MSDILKTIANRIRQHRKSKGLTQVQLSQDSGVEHRHLQKIEAGTVDLRLGTISKIAKSLNVPACYLLEDGVPLDMAKEDTFTASAVQGMVVPVLVMDTSLTIKFVNRSFTEMTGFDREELVNRRKVPELFADPHEAAVVFDFTKELLAAKPTPRPFYITYRRKDGGSVRRQIHWNYILDEHGAVRGFVCAYVDPEANSVADSFLNLSSDRRS